MDFALPPVGEGVYEVELFRWFVRPGDTVQRGQPLLEVLSDKATMEVPSPFSGKIGELRAEPGAKIKVGQALLGFTSGAPACDVPKLDTPAHGHHQTQEIARTVPPSLASASPKPVAAAPSVRLLARRLGIDLGQVRGSGPGGRILHGDLAPLVQRSAGPEGIPPGRVDSPPSPRHPALDLGRPGTRDKLLGVRRKIAENMAAAKRAIPHYAYVDECDVTDLVRLRDQLKGHFAGTKLTYLPFILKAVARALKDVPLVNSTFDEGNQEIVTHDYYHIGVAVACPAGLLVPVVKDADKKDIPTLAAEVERLSTEARAGLAKPEDLRGGTFTVTSIGGIGGLISTPIINAPQVGILGVGKVVKRPVYDDRGNLRPADMLYLSFSFDHRIVDGAVGATFGNAVNRRLSNPVALLLPE